MEDRRGTCHDLSLMFAACMEHICLYPLAVLVDGHRFVGDWRSSASHAEFWERRSQRLILDRRELRRLVDHGDEELLEATKITEPTLVSFESACAAGRDNLESRFDAAVDVRFSREYVDTLE